MVMVEKKMEMWWWEKWWWEKVLRQTWWKAQEQVPKQVQQQLVCMLEQLETSLRVQVPQMGSLTHCHCQGLVQQLHQLAQQQGRPLA